MALLASTVSLLGPLAAGTGSRAMAASAAQAPVSYQIPSLPLDEALRRVAVRGRFQILFSARDLPAVHSRPLSGVLSPDEALGHLVEPAGLRVLRLDARTYVVVAGARPPPRARTAPRVAPERADHPVRLRPPEPVQPTPVAEVTVYGQKPGQPGRGMAGHDFADSFDADLPVSQLSRERFEGGMALNITDALATLPDTTVLTTGRSFVAGVDSATRGEGLFVGLRGLSPEYSLTLINGAPVAQALPHSRGVQLNLIPPEGFSSVRIQRTGRPDLEGDLIAGTLDFRTLRADDVPERRRIELVVAGRSEQLARRYGEDGLGGSVTLMASGRFGAQDELGVAFSLREERRQTVSSEMAGVMSAQNDAGWAWGRSATPGPAFYGAPIDPQDPQRGLVLTALNVGVSEVSSRSTSAMLALDWRAASNRSFWLSLVDLKADTEQNSTLGQLVGGARQWLPDAAGGYRLSLGEVSSRLWYQTNPDLVGLTSAVLGGRLVLTGGEAGRSRDWVITPRLVFSHGTSDRPNRIEASMRINQNDRLNLAQPARPFAGLLIDYRGGFPKPRLTPELYADLDQADLRLLARRGGQKTEQHSRQQLTMAALDAEWMGGEATGLTGFKTGFSLSESTREVTERNWTNDHLGNLTGRAGLTWRDLGVTPGRYWPQAWPGIYGWRLPRVDHTALEALFERYRTPASFDSCGALFENNQNCGTQDGVERVAAAYVLVRATLGPVETLTGLRQEMTRVHSRFWLFPETAAGEQPGAWQTSRSRFDATLPSVFATWRPDPQRVIRAGLWRSYSRPALYQLGGSASLQASTGGETTLRRGNPDLRPVTAVNLDLLYQVRTPSGGWGVSVWSKWLDDYLFDGGWREAGGGGSAPDGVRLISPQNGGRAEVRGIQVEWHQSFRPALDPASRLELSATASRQWTRADLGSAEFGRRVPMQSAPDWRASAGLTLDRGPWTLFLNARYSGAFLSDYDVLEAPGDWDNLWVRPSLQADFSVHHRVGDQARLEFGVANLTDALSHESHVGQSSRVIANKVHTGRQVRLALRIKR
jgi:TonB-dependent receptor